MQIKSQSIFSNLISIIILGSSLNFQNIFSMESAARSNLSKNPDQVVQIENILKAEANKVFLQKNLAENIPTAQELAEWDNYLNLAKQFMFRYNPKTTTWSDLEKLNSSLLQTLDSFNKTKNNKAKLTWLYQLDIDILDINTNKISKKLSESLGVYTNNPEKIKNNSDKVVSMGIVVLEILRNIFNKIKSDFKPLILPLSPGDKKAFTSLVEKYNFIFEKSFKNQKNITEISDKNLESWNQELKKFLEYFKNTNDRLYNIIGTKLENINIKIFELNKKIVEAIEEKINLSRSDKTENEQKIIINRLEGDIGDRYQIIKSQIDNASYAMTLYFKDQPTSLREIIYGTLNIFRKLLSELEKLKQLAIPAGFVPRVPETTASVGVNYKQLYKDNFQNFNLFRLPDNNLTEWNNSLNKFINYLDSSELAPTGKSILKWGLLALNKNIFEDIKKFKEYGKSQFPHVYNEWEKKNNKEILKIKNEFNQYSKNNKLINNKAHEIVKVFEDIIKQVKRDYEELTVTSELSKERFSPEENLAEKAIKAKIDSVVNHVFLNKDIDYKDIDLTVISSARSKVWDNLLSQVGKYVSDTKSEDFPEIYKSTVRPALVFLEMEMNGAAEDKAGLLSKARVERKNYLNNIITANNDRLSKSKKAVDKIWAARPARRSAKAVILYLIQKAQEISNKFNNQWTEKVVNFGQEEAYIGEL